MTYAASDRPHPAIETPHKPNIAISFFGAPSLIFITGTIDKRASMDKKYEDADLLEYLYHEEGLTLSEIGDRLGCSGETIRLKMDSMDIPRKRPYEDRETLYRMYATEEKSTREVAEKLGCSHETIRRWLHRHDIPTDSPANERPPYLIHNKNGYVEARTTIDGRVYLVRMHRLLAVAEYGFDAVVDRDVHHTNGIPWDNRPSNIELISREEHTRLHHTK